MKEIFLDIYNDNRKMKVIAIEYGVSYECIKQIKNGANWNHLTGARDKKSKNSN